MLFLVLAEEDMEHLKRGRIPLEWRRRDVIGMIKMFVMKLVRLIVILSCWVVGLLKLKGVSLDSVLLRRVELGGVEEVEEEVVLRVVEGKVENRRKVVLGLSLVRRWLVLRGLVKRLLSPREGRSLLIRGANGMGLLRS